MATTQGNDDNATLAREVEELIFESSNGEMDGVRALGKNKVLRKEEVVVTRRRTIIVKTGHAQIDANQIGYKLLEIKNALVEGLDPATMLNQACQRALGKPPVFRTIRLVSEDHIPKFVSICYIVVCGNIVRTVRETKSKKNGNKETAVAWINFLKSDNVMNWMTSEVFDTYPPIGLQEDSWVRDLLREGIESNPGPPWIKSYMANYTTSGEYDQDFPGNYVAGQTVNIRIDWYLAAQQHAIETYGRGIFYLELDDVKGKYKMVLPCVNAVATHYSITIPFTPKIAKPQMKITVAFENLTDILMTLNVASGNKEEIAIADQPVWVTDIPSKEQLEALQTRRWKRDLTSDGDVEENPGPPIACPIHNTICDHDDDYLNQVYNGGSRAITSVVEDAALIIENFRNERMVEAMTNLDGILTTEEIHTPEDIEISDEDESDEEIEELRHELLMTKLRVEDKGVQHEFSRSYFEDHLNMMAKSMSNRSIWAEHVITYYPNIAVRTQNRFQVLEEDNMEIDEITKTFDNYYEDKEKSKQQPQSRVNSVRDEKSDEERLMESKKDRRKKRENRNDQKKEEELTPSQKLEREQIKRDNQRHAVERIAKSWKEQPWKVIKAIKLKMRRAYFGKVMAQYTNDINWTSWEEMDDIEYCAMCYLEGIDDKFMRAKVSLLDTRVQSWTYNRNQDWELYYEQTFGDDWYETIKVLAEEGALHNKLVHAYNGNPTFSKYMEDIDKTKNWPAFYDVNKNGKKLLGSSIQTLFSYLPSEVSIMSTDLSKQDSITANVINADNTSAGPCSQRFPNTSLMPRQVRQADKTLVQSNQRLQTHMIDVSDYVACDLEQTALSEQLTQAVRNQNASAWRKDNTTLSGFNMFDLMGINNVPSIKGLSLEQIMAKLDMLHSVLARSQQTMWIPRSEFDAIDSTTIPTVQNPVLGINDSPIFGEACGGQTAVFPFSNEAGTLAFHLTIASIPEERRPNAIFMPPAILQALESGYEAIALFVLMWAEWPFGMYTITKQTTDDAGQNQGNQLYIANECTTKIPGYHVLDIVLPRQSSAANPTAAGQANNLAVTIPRTGPVASTAFAANDDLDISFIGPQGRHDYNLAEYLYTWATAFDITSIRSFITRMNAIINVNDGLLAAHEVNLSCHSQFGIMIEQTADNARQIAHNTIVQQRTGDVCCFWKPQTTANWPAPAGRGNYDRILLRTDIISWNQVVLGLRTNEQLRPQLSNIPEHIGDPRCAYWEAIKAQVLASVFNMHYANIGISTLSWEEAFTNTTMISYQRLAKDLYCQISQSGQLSVGRFGNALRYLMANTTGYQPSVIELLGFEVTVFHRLLPQKDFTAPMRIAGNVRMTMMIPCTLVDVQIHFLCESVPKWQCSYPPPSGRDGTQGYHENLELLRTTNLATASGYVDKEIINPALDSNLAPDVEDETLWNLRLMWWSTNTRVIAAYTGTAFNAGPYVIAGAFIKQRNRINYPGLVAGTSSLNANTIAIPRATSNGLRIFPFEPINIAELYIKAMVRVTQLSYPAWLIDNVLIQPTILAYSNRRDKWHTLVDKTNFDMVETANLETEKFEEQSMTLKDQLIDPVSS